MGKKMADPDKPIGKLTRVKDFLPPPGNLAKPARKIPKFKSKEEERKFWETHDIVSYESGLKKVNATFPRPGRASG